MNLGKFIFLFIIFASFAGANFINIETENIQFQKRIDFLNKKVDSLKNLPSQKQLEEINKLFNVFIAYASDKEVYGKNNHIAVVEETIKSMKGDCDDYVMAKAQALSYLGFKEQYVLYSTVRGIRHVKLIVKYDGVYYVLDNSNKKFRVLMNSELKEAGNKLYSADLYLIAAKQKLATLKKI